MAWSLCDRMQHHNHSVCIDQRKHLALWRISYLQAHSMHSFVLQEIYVRKELLNAFTCIQIIFMFFFHSWCYAHLCTLTLSAVECVIIWFRNWLYSNWLNDSSENFIEDSRTDLHGVDDACLSGEWSVLSAKLQR